MILRGSPVAPGIVVGRVLRYEQPAAAVSTGKIRPGEVEENLRRYEDLRARAKQELAQIIASLMDEKPDDAAIFKAHISILQDEVMHEEITGAIRGLDPPDRALNDVFSRYAALISQAKDPLISERAADLADVRERLLRLWSGAGSQNLSHLPEDVVLAARELYPSDTVTMDTAHVRAIVTEQGGETSHTAILARSQGIPAVVGLNGLMAAVRDGDDIIVNAVTGTVETLPGRMALIEAGQTQAAYAARRQSQDSFLAAPSKTKDGVPVKICLNLGSTGPRELALAHAADGVGLLRTEFLFMSRTSLPDEEEQYRAYADIAERFAPRPVTIRTLDIGGDKQLPSLKLPPEDNPALGRRALRLCFAYPRLFKTQLRAILRASAAKNVQVMFPMVASLDDLRRAKEILEEAKAELALQGIPFDPGIQAGIMVEIPSIALVAEHAAQEAAFASIGTNDLCQYLFAADRTNAEVARYSQEYHPALLKLVSRVARAFAAEGKEVSVCGEMAGEPGAAALFIGMGIRKLSMNQSSLAPVKQMLNGLDSIRALRVAEAVTHLATEAEVRAAIEQEL